MAGAQVADREKRWEDWWQGREQEACWRWLQTEEPATEGEEKDYREFICLADGLWRADRLPESLSWGKKGLEALLKKSAGDPKWLGRCQLTRGIAAHSMGQHEAALSMLKEAVSASRQAGELNDAAQATNNLGLLHRNVGAFGLALESLQLAKRLFEESGDEAGSSKVLLNMALVLDRIGQKEKAVDLGLQVREIRKKLGEDYLLANACTNLGIILQHSGYMAEAETAFREALQISTGKGYVLEAAEALYGYAGYLESLGKIEEAVDACHRGLDLSTENGLPLQEQKLLRNLAWILIDAPARKEEVLRHPRIREILDSQREEQDELLSLLIWLRDRANPQGNPDYLTRTELQFARYWESRGNYRKAFEHLDLYRDYDNRLQDEQLRGQVSNLQVAYEVDELVKETQKARRRSQELEQEKQELGEVLAELKTINDWQIQQLGKVAHDLKNPLGVTLTLIELSKETDDGRREDELEENLGLMESAVRQALGEVEDLLQSAQLRYAKGLVHPVRFACGPMLEPLMALHDKTARAKAIRLVWEIEPDLWLETDRNRLRDIVNNLISNALKYSPPETEVRMRAYGKDGSFFLEVMDEGPGFSEGDREKLFGMFRRLSAQPTGGESSTGLGLFITRKCVEALQGRIQLVPGKGLGAHFRVELPMRLGVAQGGEGVLT